MGVTEWKRLPVVHKIIIVLATCLAMISGFMFAFFSESCFENFTIASKIEDPIDEHGLDGNVFNIIILPMGAVSLVLYAIGAVLHLVFVMETARLTRAELKPPGPEDAVVVQMMVILPNSPTHGWAQQK